MNDRYQDVLTVCVLHGAKLHEAAEALDLLKKALHALDADKPLREILTAETPCAQLIVGELVETALYEFIRNAERHVQHAQTDLRNFMRVFKSAHGIYIAKEISHD